MLFHCIPSNFHVMTSHLFGLTRSCGGRVEADVKVDILSNSHVKVVAAHPVGLTGSCGGRVETTWWD